MACLSVAADLGMGLPADYAMTTCATFDTHDMPAILDLVHRSIRRSAFATRELDVEQAIARALSELPAVMGSFLPGHCETARRLSQRMGFPESFVDTVARSIRTLEDASCFPCNGDDYRVSFGIGLCFAVSERSVASMQQEDPMEAREHESFKKLISRIADDIWNGGRLAVIDEVMSSDGKYHGPHMPNGLGDRETWKRAIGMYRSAFPDSHVTFEELIASGDTIVGRWRATGTHTGELPGLPPTGKPINIGGITIYRFREGKVVEAWEHLDMLGMWQQLGVVTLPRHQQ
jgi:predicted ester cyclase